MPRTSPYSIALAEAERTELEARARRYTSSYSEVVRARIVLYAAEGLGNDEIAARLDTPRQVVSKWRKTKGHPIVPHGDCSVLILR
jgi:DNA-directed RNA polymerase specialized sigma24 family protein